MDIPEDVMKAAVDAAHKTMKFGGIRGELTTIGYDATVGAIANAILAERERTKAKVQEAPKREHTLTVTDTCLKLMASGSMVISGTQQEMAQEILFLRDLLNQPATEPEAS